MLVVGWRQLVEAFYWSGVKSAARRVANLIPAVWCEKDLVPAVWMAGRPCSRFDEQILTRIQNGRKAANLLIADDERTGTVISATIKKHGKTLLLHDAQFSVEMAWWRSVVGPHGGELMASKVKEILSTREGTKILTLTEVSQQVERLMKSSLFNFVLPQFQNEVSGLAGWLKALKSGETPKLPANSPEAISKTAKHIAKKQASIAIL